MGIKKSFYHENYLYFIAAVYLAECLPENRALRRLDLTQNMGIDLAGLMALSASVRLNDTLTYVDINIPVSIYSH